MKKGFTLIELLAVVLIMGILTAVALPQYRRSVERSRVAEALQMLPAIYDARERLVVERGWSWSSYSTATNVSFGKLDIDMKGKPVGNSQFETENFLYSVSNRCLGSVCSVAGEPWVSAELLKGTYKGTKIYFKGNKLLCCPGTNNSDACSRLNVEQGQCGISL